MENKFDTLTTELRSLLGDRCSTGDSIIDLHSRDAAYTPPVKPHAVVFPENTEEVSSIVKLCSEKNCPIVAFGVGSSLEGQVVPVVGGVSVDFSRMNKITAVQTLSLIHI